MAGIAFEAPATGKGSKLEKAELVLYEPATDGSQSAPGAELNRIAFHFNPKELTLQKDARFLMAPAEALTSLERQPDCGELDEIAWVELEEALHLELPGVTRFVVKEIAQRLIEPERPALYMRFVGRRSRVTTI